ncbi:MAG: helix-turn-helix domain-containing protein [Gemmatimonadaceae bacterium]
MKLKDRVAARIKALRRGRGLTQEDLAERIERTVDAVSNLERGVSLPSFDTLERLARALHAPVRDFFDDDGRGRVSAKRAALTATLADYARSLPDADLELAVEQVKAIAARSSSQHGKR